MFAPAAGLGRRIRRIVSQFTVENAGKNALLDGFEGKLTTGKWAAIAKCSPDTALRDLDDLVARGVLRKSDSGGRSTNYELNDLPT